MGFDITVYKGSKEGGIVKSITPYNGLGPHEILVRITHSGVCGTDEHYKRTDIVLGHEGVGVVQEIGQDVKEFKMFVFSITIYDRDILTTNTQR